VLNELLNKYADVGVVPIEETQILNISPFPKYGTPVEIIQAFGGVDKYQKAIHDLELAIYSA